MSAASVITNLKQTKMKNVPLYRLEIDGLRALAVASIIFFHAKIFPFTGGFVGVDVFFVISGYLMTRNIMSLIVENEFSFIQFYETRARRLLPALNAMLLMTFPFGFLFLSHVEFNDYSKAVVSSLTFSSNLYYSLTAGYFDISSEYKPLLHTWSLSLEEQFYLIYPFILILFIFNRPRLFGTLILITLVSIMLANSLNIKHPAFSFYMLPTRIWEFFFGTAAFFVEGLFIGVIGWRRELLAIFGVILMLFSIFYFSEATPYPGFWTLVPVTGALIFIIFATNTTSTGKIFSLPIATAVGHISYSSYLWHLPIIIFASLYIGDSINLMDKIFFVLFAFICGGLSTYLIENPFRNKKIIPLRLFLLLILSSTTLLTAISAYSISENGMLRSYGATEEKIYKVQSEESLTKVCHSGPGYGGYIPPSQSCVGGNKLLQSAALIGDSHADSLFFDLTEKLKDQEFGVRYMSYTACPPILGLSGDCGRYNDDVYNYIIHNSDIKYVILFARWPLYFKDDVLDLGHSNKLSMHVNSPNLNSLEQNLYLSTLLEKTILQYTGAGKSIILVYPVPAPNFDVPNTLGRILRKNRGKLNATDGSFLEANYIREHANTISFLDNVVKKNKSVIKIDPVNVICNLAANGVCLTQVDGYPIYRDDNHLSNAGANILNSLILNALKERMDFK